MRLLTRIPELTLLIAIIIVGYIVSGIFSQVEGNDVLSPTAIWLVVAGSFLMSTIIAVIAVIAGVGGGVLYTPVMLAFTSIDTLIIRATGLVVAMFSGLISTGPFMRRGLADIRIILFCSVPYVIGATAGGTLAIFMAACMGATGDAILRLSLGTVLLFVAFLFISGGASYEYPQGKKPDWLSKMLKLKATYYEESLQKPVQYEISNAFWGCVLFLLVGLLAGFFGLGGGWAAVPVLNLVMSAPLKIAAASSGVLLAIGNATAIWPYIIYGALIALFVTPWMLGQVVGGILGAYVLVKVRAGFIRYFLIAFLILSCIKLISRGIEGLLGVDIPVL